MSIFTKVFQEWLLTSSSRALPNIARTPSWILRSIWLVLFLASNGYCMYLMIKLIIQFTNNETSIQISVLRDSPAEFPAVSICNLNPYNLVSNNSKSYIDDVINSEKLDYFAPTDSSRSQEFLSTVKRIVATDIKKDDNSRRALGFDLKTDMLLSCFFNAAPCYASQFSYFWSDDYGNCYTFNNGKDQNNSNQKILKTNKAGSDFGLHLELIVGDPANKNFLSEMSNTRGVHVIVHNRTASKELMPNGISASTGTETYFSVTRSIVKSLPSPYSKCVESLNAYKSITDYSKKLHSYMIGANVTDYDEAFCYDLCFQDILSSQCSCGEIGIPLINNKEYCRNTTELDCLNRITTNFSVSNNEIACNYSCPPACEEQDFDLSEHIATYPTEFHYQQLITIAKNVSTNNAFPFLNDTLFSLESLNFSSKQIYDLIQRNILKIKVNYELLSYTKTEMTPSMTIETFLGNFGGQLGLFIGISFLSVFELMDLVYALINAYKKARVVENGTKLEEESKIKV